MKSFKKTQTSIPPKRGQGMHFLLQYQVQKYTSTSTNKDEELQSNEKP